MFESTSNLPGKSAQPPEGEVLLFDVHGRSWRWGSDPDGTPWAVASDVARSFDYRDAPNCIRILDEDERDTRLVSTPSGLQEQWVIFEDGLWELVFRSTKPEAKLLKKRIKQILHQLRTGEMKLVSADDSLAALELLNERMGKAISIAKAERARADAAEEQLAITAPKAENWEVLASADKDFAVADAAKILSRDPAISTGRNRLFDTMAELGWVFRQRGDQSWRAYQAAVDAGRLAELPQKRPNVRSGKFEIAAPQVRVTAKGIAELRRLLGGSDELPIAA